jgi:hypothetical protein
VAALFQMLWIRFLYISVAAGGVGGLVVDTVEENLAEGEDVGE